MTRDVGLTPIQISLCKCKGIIFCVNHPFVLLRSSVLHEVVRETLHWTIVSSRHYSIIVINNNTTVLGIWVGGSQGYRVGYLVKIIVPVHFNIIKFVLYIV